MNPGSELCTRCAACCSGALHVQGALSENEVDQARALGLRVRAIGGRAEFLMPCSRQDGTRCGIYESRPRVCAEYRCLLLKKYQAGEVPLDRALAIVEEFRAAAEAAFVRLRAVPSGPIIAEVSRRENAAADPAAFRREHSKLLLALARVRALSRHFKERPGSAANAHGRSA